MVKEVLKTRSYKAGYEVRTELINGDEYGGPDFEMKSAYNPNGDYIGSSKRAYRLCKKNGIAPELAKDHHKVCSIGFCEKEQKWYGWSHRAIYGFGVGHTVDEGHCGYRTGDKDKLAKELREEYKWSLDKGYICNFRVRKNKKSITVTYEQANRKMRKKPKSFEIVAYGPTQWERHKHIYFIGKGKWTAKTLEDAKEMAVDFAESVS